MYRSEIMSSAEESARAEPQNFDHKQVLSKMNHFDFSNALSQSAASNKASTSPPREKRLNYQPSNAVQHVPVRYSYSGGQSIMQQQQQQQSVAVSSPLSTAMSPSVPVKSVKIEHPTQPNYHSIVVPIPISHQMYASIGGDPTSAAHGHQLASATVQQAMMSLPVVHNVFFKTDEHGGGQTMPAIVIPLKPEYLQQLQQQQYSGGGLTPPVADDSQNAAGHQRPVHHGSGGGGGGLGPKTLQYQQQQQMTPSPYVSQQQQKHAKPSKVVKKPFGLVKDEHHRVKQPFTLHQHQFFNNNNNNPFTSGGHFGHVGGGHQHHQLQQLHGHQQHDAADDSRYSPSAIVPSTPSAVLHPFPTAGHSLVVKRPNAYGYVAPKYVTVHKNPPAQQQQQQLQQPMSTEELASAIVQQQQQQQQQHHQHVMQPAFKASAYNPGYAYLSGQDEDYPYRPIYKDMNKRNDEPLHLQGVRNERRK